MGFPVQVRLAGLAAILVASAAPAWAQIPRTPDGHPDMQGFWATEFLTPLERPDKFPDLIIKPDQREAAIKEFTPDFGKVYDPELDYTFPTGLLVMGGEARSSVLIEPADGKLPLTALARAAADHFEQNYDGPENRPGAERCVDSLGHAPLRAVSFVIPFQLVQTPGAIVLAMDDTDPARIIPMGGPPLPDAIRTEGGSSRGRWDGDTLVIETDHISISHHSGIAWRDAALVTEDSVVIERLTLISADEMLYQFTVRDPALYKQPWLAEYTIQRSAHPPLEYACHEGNHGLLNILTAARMGLQEEDKK